MTELVSFYLGETPDCEGRWIEEIWDFNDDQLEYTHDYVQWLFPLKVPSNFNPDAPLLTEEDIAEFRKDKLLQRNLLRSFHVFANFLGLELTHDGKVVKADWFEDRQVLWKHMNHNWFRITRVITSLRELGLDYAAQAFFVCLKELHEEGYASDNSFDYWKQAAVK